RAPEETSRGTHRAAWSTSWRGTVACHLRSPRPTFGSFAKNGPNGPEDVTFLHAPHSSCRVNRSCPVHSERRPAGRYVRLHEAQRRDRDARRRAPALRHRGAAHAFGAVADSAAAHAVRRRRLQPSVSR